MKFKIKKLLADYLGCNVRCVEDSYYDEEVVVVLNKEYLVISKDESSKRVKEFVQQMIDEDGIGLFDSSLQKWILQNALIRKDYLDTIIKNIICNYVYSLSFNQVLEELEKLNEISKETKETLEDSSWYLVNKEQLLDKLIAKLSENKEYILNNLSYYGSNSEVLCGISSIELNLEKIFDKVASTYPLAYFLSSDKQETMLKDKLGHEWFVYKQN